MGNTMKIKFNRGALLPSLPRQFRPWSGAAVLNSGGLGFSRRGTT